MNARALLEALLESDPYDEQAELSVLHVDSPVYGKETYGDWLERHQVPRNDAGLYRFYHGTPKKGGATDVLRAGSLLEINPHNAILHARHNRGLRANDINLHELWVRPSQIVPGFWASTTVDLPLDMRRMFHHA